MAGKPHEDCLQDYYFAQLISEGYNATNAFIRAYPESKAKSRQVAQVMASRRSLLPHIVERIKILAEANRLINEGKPLTRGRKLLLLQEIAEDVKINGVARLRAVEVHNRMSGDDAPQDDPGKSVNLAELLMSPAGSALLQLGAQLRQRQEPPSEA